MLSVNKENVKRLNIINGCVRCIVYVNHEYKLKLDEIYNEDDIKIKFQLLESLHISCDNTIHKYVIMVGLLMYHINNEIEFYKIFNKFGSEINMNAAIQVECKVGNYVS